jgi:murein DD-endopeptidase MepM/ murein hydrolase activator NlpD
LHRPTAAVHRLLSHVALPAISAVGLHSFLRPISDSFSELVGHGRSRAAASSSAASTDLAPSAARSFGTGGGVRRIAESPDRYDFIERLIPVGICLLLVAAAVVSSLPVVKSASAAGLPKATSPALGLASPATSGDPTYSPGSADAGILGAGNPYLGDGSIPNTMQNPGVGTDAKSMLLTYTVQPGDTLNRIGGKFEIAASTIYWANKAQLPNPDSLRQGQQLLIPPMDGLLVSVGAKDTLDSLAAKYKVSALDIADANNLPDSSVVLGQTLLIPGASGGPMPASKSGTASSGGGGGGGGYNGGSFRWPVSGYNYISQYFWSGHHALDIAASEGTPVVAAAGGTVVLVGNRGFNGGGNVVWVQESASLFTTYNHLSAWNVRVGQTLSAGQRVGSVGHTGDATGPHLHFEVWLGYPWALGNNSDAVNPCRYLAAC